MSHFDIATAQGRAWSALARAFAAGRMASTYLFYGPDGCGVWPLAIEFAALANCAQPTTADNNLLRPCGTCAACRGIRNLNFAGLHLVVPIPPHKKPGDAIDLTNEALELKRVEPFALLDSAANATIPISLAREVKKHLTIKATAGVTRVVLFYQMEKMRAASADALLKMIEEPPPDTVIILTAVNPEALLPTILSRARKVRLQKLSEPTMVPYLLERYQSSETQARLAARVSQGSLGAAIALVQASQSEGHSDRAVGLMLFKALLADSSGELISRAVDLINPTDRPAAAGLVRLWQSLVRDCAYYASTGDSSGLVNVDFESEIKQLAPRFADWQVVKRLIEISKNTLADLILNVHIQIALLAMALKLREALQEAGR